MYLIEIDNGADLIYQECKSNESALDFVRQHGVGAVMLTITHIGADGTVRERVWKPRELRLDDPPIDARPLWDDMPAWFERALARRRRGPVDYAGIPIV